MNCYSVNWRYVMAIWFPSAYLSRDLTACYTLKFQITNWRLYSALPAIIYFLSFKATKLFYTCTKYFYSYKTFLNETEVTSTNFDPPVFMPALTGQSANCSLTSQSTHCPLNSQSARCPLTIQSEGKRFILGLLHLMLLPATIQRVVTRRPLQKNVSPANHRTSSEHRTVWETNFKTSRYHQEEFHRR